LRRRGQLGRIVPGALADMIALPFSGNFGTVYDEIIAHMAPVLWTMIDGEITA
jgi:aminodeoxyfutalosine deaminase